MRHACLTLCLALSLAFSARAAGAQDLATYALDWARGEFRAPLVCKVEDEHRRALRRLLIRPKPGRHLTPANQLLLFDLEAPPGLRCANEAGGEAPNLSGRIEFGLDARSRPDLARHEFDSALRRDGGFDYAIRSGALQIASLEDPDAARTVDFRGGTLRLRLVEPKSDAARRLADFLPHRLLALTLEAPDGTRLDLELAQVDGR